MSTTIGLPSRRIDVATGLLLKATVPKSGESYTEYSEESTKGAKEAEKLIKEIFAPLLR